MRAETCINPERDRETLVELYDTRNGEERLICWGGANLMTGVPYIVFTPPHGIPHYSVKQEKLFKVFLLAAHITFCYTGSAKYEPAKVFDAYKVVFPPEYHPYGSPQELPGFAYYG